MDRKKTRKDKIRLDKIIGKNIRTERELRNITRDELAEVTDLTVSHLGLIERGERGATPVTLEKIVKAFGITIDSLFTEQDKSISVKDKRNGTNNNTFYKKVTTLITQLSESELEFIAHTIKGIVTMRNPKTKTNKAEKN